MSRCKLNAPALTKLNKAAERELSFNTCKNFLIAEIVPGYKYENNKEELLYIIKLSLEAENDQSSWVDICTKYLNSTKDPELVSYKKDAEQTLAFIEKGCAVTTSLICLQETRLELFELLDARKHTEVETKEHLHSYIENVLCTDSELWDQSSLFAI